MSRARVFLIYWLPVVVWMAVIFSASGDTDSFNRSSRIIGPILDILLPGLSDRARDQLVFIARKGAHVTEYAILALLFWRALQRPAKGDHRWSWKAAGWTVAFVALYATTDELHQQFVPSRYGSPMDVLIDTIGGGIGLALLRGIYWWRDRRRGGTETRSVDQPSSQSLP